MWHLKFVFLSLWFTTVERQDRTCQYSKQMVYCKCKTRCEAGAAVTELQLWNYSSHNHVVTVTLSNWSQLILIVCASVNNKIASKYMFIFQQIVQPLSRGLIAKLRSAGALADREVWGVWYTTQSNGGPGVLPRIVFQNCTSTGAFLPYQRACFYATMFTILRHENKMVTFKFVLCLSFYYNADC